LSLHISDQSVLILLEYYRKDNVLLPIGVDDWLSRCQQVFANWVVNHTSDRVRTSALLLLMQICRTTVEMYPEVIIDTLVLPCIHLLPHEVNETIRSSIYGFLLDMTKLYLENGNFGDLLKELVKNLYCNCPTHTPPPPVEEKVDAAKAFRNMVSSPSARAMAASAMEPEERHAFIVQRVPPLFTCLSERTATSLCELFASSLFAEYNFEACEQLFGELVNAALASDRVHAASRKIIIETLLSMTVGSNHRIGFFHVDTNTAASTYSFSS
jgi:hypothetical protein